jgi:hypothetical protein
MPNKGFETEQIARERAARDFTVRRVVIIESGGQYYVEPEDQIGMLRSWEREVYAGLGRNARRRGDR